MGSITIEVLEGEHGILPKVEEPWASCLGHAPECQQLFSFGWFNSWMSTHGNCAPWTGKSQLLVAKTAQGECLGILPLAFQRQKRLRVLSMAGYYQPLRGFVCAAGAAEQVCRGFVETLIGKPMDWDLLRLGPFDTGSQENELLMQQFRSAACHPTIIPRGRAIVARNLVASFQQYKETVLSQRFVKDIEYYERRLRREGEMIIRHFNNPRGVEIDTLLDDCRSVENNSWLAVKSGSLRFATETDFRFWRNILTNSLDSRRQFDTWIMYFNRKPVSYCVTISAGTTRYIIANQFDQQFRKHSTGSILYFHAFQQGSDTGIRQVDFAPGDIHYKGRWGGKEDSMRFDAFIFAPGIKGNILRNAFETLCATKRVLRSTTWGRRIAITLPDI